MAASALVTTFAGQASADNFQACPTDAHGNQEQCSCGTNAYYACPVDWVPGHYSNLNGGDAVLFPLPDKCPQTDAICLMMKAVQIQNSHVMLGYGSGGQSFIETQWDGTPPPATVTTGGAHQCSRVVDAPSLQNLSPGTGQPGFNPVCPDSAVGHCTVPTLPPGNGNGSVTDQARIISNQVIVQGSGPEFCNNYPDPYHINSILNNDVIGGTCEKHLVDRCGLNVDYNPNPKNADANVGDQYVAPPAMLNAGLETVYGFAYAAITGSLQNNPLSGKWEHYLCGGVDNTIIAQRAGMQFVNEILWKSNTLRLPDGNTTDTLGMDNSAAGLTTMQPVIHGSGQGKTGSWNGYGGNPSTQYEYLGGALQNTQFSGPSYTNGYYCTNTNQSNQTPGGHLQGGGLSCPAWQNYGQPIATNVPDNILIANKRHNELGVTTSTVSGAYWHEQPCGCFQLPPPEKQITDDTEDSFDQMTDQMIDYWIDHQDDQDQNQDDG